MAPSPQPNGIVSVQKAKYSRACNFCRLKKVRCEGGSPCKQCVDHGEECTFTAKRRSRTRVEQSQKTLSQRVIRLESLLSTAPATTESPPGAEPGSFNSQIRHMLTGTPNLPQDRGAPWPQSAERLGVSQSSLSRLFVSENTEPSNIESYTAHAPPGEPHVGHSSGESPIPTFNASNRSTILTTTVPNTLHTFDCASSDEFAPTAHHTDVSVAHEDSSVQSDEMSNWEYNGPRSFLSICSQSGINWVESRVQAPGVKESILRFTRDLLRRMKTEPGASLQSKQRTPEPPKATAWVYTTCFFDEAFDARTGILDRSWFENALRTHFAASKHDQDHSWYALRNTVYAFGCRMSLGTSQSYSVAVHDSMLLFENALSVQTEILQSPSSMTSVRALALMAFFTEGIGCPHLQYMLLSNAMRLAISKGLHRQPAISWNLSKQEIRQRQWLFWNMYSLDRQISARSGRPPVIDEDEISCGLPESAVPGESMNFAFTTICVKIAQLLSRAHKRLASARALRQSFSELVGAVTVLHGEVNVFKRSIDHLVPLDDPLDVFSTPQKMPLLELMIIYSLYYGLIFEIHSPLLIPWYHDGASKQLEQFHPQIERSSLMVASTARAAILASRFSQINANSTTLLALYIPFRAVIHLFTYILKHPEAETTQSDLVLLDVAAGYASRLEFTVDGSMSFPFIKDFAQFARLAVDRASATREESSRGFTLHPLEVAIACRSDDESLPNATSNDDSYLDAFYDPSFEFNMELWSAGEPLINSEEIDMSIYAG